MLSTVLRESFTSEQFARIPEPDLVMDSEEAVSAFARASQPGGVLSGVYAFLAEQACKMIRPGDRVLDLGCGPASLLATIARRCPDADFLGVDLSEGMIHRGREQLESLAVENVELRIEDMTRLRSIDPGTVDVVLSSMAIHHLPGIGHLQRFFEATERVAAPDARIFLADFGRVRSLKSVEYLVRRAIPRDEPVLEHDYRASLRAAFSQEEMQEAMPASLRRRLGTYATIFSPVMVVLMTPFPASPRGGKSPSEGSGAGLPWSRLADLWQLRLLLRLGGMPAR